MSTRVRLIMMISAISFAAGMFGILALNSSLHEDSSEQNFQTKIPALGPKSARPKAVELRWESKGQWSSISDLKGQVVYINFWASWCEPCKTELPEIEKIKQQYSSDKLRILMINLDESPDDLILAQQMLKDLAPSTEGIFKGGSELRELYNILALPLHVVIDKEGLTAASFYSRIDDKADEFAELIQNLVLE